MATVRIPPLMQDLTGSQEQVQAQGATVGELLEHLEQRFPGMQDRLCDGDRLKPNIAVAVDGEILSQGLRATVRPESDVQFLPAISGGAP